MKRTALFSLGLMILALFATSAVAAHHAVKIATSDTLGSYLTDKEGMTLYYFKNDAPGMSACKGGCVDKWPLYYRETVAPPEGVEASDFGTITREDGKKQTTFRGYPLYYWVGDSKPGDTNGNDIKDVWYVIDPAHFPAMH